MQVQHQSESLATVDHGCSCFGANASLSAANAAVPKVLPWSLRSLVTSALGNMPLRARLKEPTCPKHAAASSQPFNLRLRPDPTMPGCQSLCVVGALEELENPVVFLDHLQRHGTTVTWLRTPACRCSSWIWLRYSSSSPSPQRAFRSKSPTLLDIDANIWRHQRRRVLQRLAQCFPIGLKVLKRVPDARARLILTEKTWKQGKHQLSCCVRLKN